MSQIVRQIISEYSEQSLAPFGLDEFSDLKEMVDHYRWREWVTESENYGTEEVAEEITTHSADPQINQICKAIQEHQFPLQLRKITRRIVEFVGDSLSSQRHRKKDRWRLENGQGHSIDIELPAKAEDGIFVAWYRVDKECQGNGFAAKRFMLAVSNLLLEVCGYPFLHGKSSWAFDTEERGLPDNHDRRRSWRWKAVHVGWAADGKPLFEPGLLLFYLKTKWIRNPARQQQIIDGTVDPYRCKEIMLLSSAEEQKLKTEQPDLWAKLTQHRRSNRLQKKQNAPDLPTVQLEELIEAERRKTEDRWREIDRRTDI